MCGSDSGEGEASEAEEPAADDVIVEMEDPWAENTTPSGDGARADDDDRPLEFTDERSRDLHQHLIWQLEISPLDPRQLWIGEAIVDALNDDGYLTRYAGGNRAEPQPRTARVSGGCRGSARVRADARSGRDRRTQHFGMHHAAARATRARDAGARPCHQHRTRPPAGRSQPQCRGTAAIARLGRRIRAGGA